MALALAKAAPLKPQIKLPQVLFEFQAILSDDQKKKLLTYRGHSPPNPSEVMRFTAEIDRDTKRNRKSRQCVGPRLTNVLHAVQQFSTVVDPVVGSSQIAGAIWGTVKISLQLASAISSYFDQLSTLFMKIGRNCPIYQDIGLLYPESTRLQSALCEYFVVIVCLCKKAVLFLKKPFWSQLPSSILNPFESEFGHFQQELEDLASAIREEVSLASNQALQNIAKEMSRFRSIAKNFSDSSTREIEEARKWKRKKVESQFLNAISVFNHEKSWKQARKRGNTNWICNDERYKQWKQEKVSSTLWCTGILGSGKTVLSANVVEDLKITTPAVVAYFFCSHDESKSLKAQVIIGSIARQIFDHTKLDTVDAVEEVVPGAIDTDQILDYLQELLPSSSQKYFIIIDGLDECEEKESRLLLLCLKQLLRSKHVFQVYCSSRPDVTCWAHTLLEPQWNVSMSQTSTDIEEYVKDTLVERLESGNLSLGDSTVILAIQDALLKNAHGMFLWVAFQIDSICSQKTDEAILTALEDLPKDLPDTFNRILRKLQHSNAADPQFCRKIFDLVAAAQRPLTLEELREAISVTPGVTSWDASKLVNDMLRLLLDSCGSLVAVDEEHLTVHFTHHSIKQHLLSDPMDSDVRDYHINMREAGLRMGDIIVTYLNFGIFDRQLTKAKSPMVPQVRISPSALLGGSLPRQSIANRLAVKLLKSRENSSLDIHSQLKTVGIVDESIEQILPANPFLPYAQAYWLFHTKAFKPARAAEYSLWERLIDEEIKTIELPWASEKWIDFGDKYMEWIIRNDHWALVNRSLVHLAEIPFFSNHVIACDRLLLFLQTRATDVNIQNINFEAVLYLASLRNNKIVALLSIRKRTNAKSDGGYYGNALEAASKCGNEEIVKLLLENGANSHREVSSTALQEASMEGHEKIVELLLEHGANVNAQSRRFGTALQAASKNGREKVAALLLANGATANAHGERFGTALQAASRGGHKEIVRLLLESGAIANDTTLTLASDSGNEEVQRLIRKALKSQSSLQPGPTTTIGYGPLTILSYKHRS